MMDDATQKLVNEVIRRTPMRITDEGIVMQASEVEAMIADALEAAQRPLFNPPHESVCGCGATGNGECVRPPVGPEVREALVDTLTSPVRAPGSVAASRVFRAETPEDLEDATALADAILARFSIPERPPVSLPTEPGLYSGQRATRWELDAEGAWWFRGYEDGSHPTPHQQDRTPSDVLNYGRPLTPLRPPVSPEQREAVRAVVGEQLTRAGLDLDGPPFADDGETQWPIALELRDRMTDALVARFSLPVLDVEKVARAVHAVHARRWCLSRDGETCPEARQVSAALVASLSTLTTDGTPSNTEKENSHG